MLTAITMRQMTDSKFGTLDVLERNYADHYSRYGLELLPIPNIGPIAIEWMKSLPLKRIILSGGDDISPQMYGDSQEATGEPNKRDETEYALLEYAVSKELPVLGICRGAQLINVYFGGSLVRDLAKQKGNVPHVAKNHSINLVETRLLERAVTSEHVVNSYHNQGISEANLAKALRSFAIASDGTIEGVYHPEFKIAGVMWHPERPSPSFGLDDLIITAFANQDLYWK